MPRRLIVDYFCAGLDQWRLRIGDVDFAGYWRDVLERAAAAHPDVQSFVIMAGGTAVMGLYRSETQKGAGPA